MVFRKDNFSVSDGWEPSHGAIAAYHAAKKVRLASADLPTERRYSGGHTRK